MRRFSLLLLGSGLLAACAPDNSPTALSAPEVSAASVAQREDQDAQLFARSLAMALANPDIRVQLRNAWRDSRVSSDHKLVSTDYFVSAAGANVVAEMARRSGQTADALKATIQRLPSLDVYLPIREHRSTWKASDDVLVGATFDQNASEIQAFDIFGAKHRVLGVEAKSGPPLVVMHLAEPKYEMHGGQRFSTGEVIQLADAYPSVQPPDETSPRQASIGTSSLMSTAIRVKYFDAFRNDGPFGGDLEMEFRASGYEGNFTPSWDSWSGIWIFPSSCLLGVGTANLPDQPPVSVNVFVLTATIMPAGCTGTHHPVEGFEMWAVEMDGSIGSEDDFGRRVSTPGPQPYGYNVTSTSGCCSLWYYSGPGVSPGLKSIFMAMQID